MNDIKFKLHLKRFPFLCLTFIDLLHLQIQLGLEVYVFSATAKENEFFH